MGRTLPVCCLTVLTIICGLTAVSIGGPGAGNDDPSATPDRTPSSRSVTSGDRYRELYGDDAGDPSLDPVLGVRPLSVSALPSNSFMQIVVDQPQDGAPVVCGNAVEIFGIQDEHVFLNLSNAKMAKFGVSPSRLHYTRRSPTWRPSHRNCSTRWFFSH